MKTTEKQAIAARLKEYCENKGSQNKAAVLGGHTGTEAVPTLANQVRRLKGALHRGSPSDVTRTPSGFEGR